jgi:hypothetical protein
MGIVNRELEAGIAIGVDAGIHVSASVGISDAAECALTRRTRVQGKKHPHPHAHRHARLHGAEESSS